MGENTHDVEQQPPAGAGDVSGRCNSLLILLVRPVPYNNVMTHNYHWNKDNPENAI